MLQYIIKNIKKQSIFTGLQIEKILAKRETRDFIEHIKRLLYLVLKNYNYVQFEIFQS